MRKCSFHRYGVVVLVILTIGALLGYYQITPTKVPKEFQEQLVTIEEVKGEKADLNMLLSHVNNLAREPHPTGSQAIEGVRTYIIEQLETMGIEYETQEFRKSMKADIERKVADYDAFMQAHPEEKEGFDRALWEAGFLSYEDKYRWSINCVNGDELDFVNFLVKIDGRGAERGVLFVSHYDSTIGGPGAADDAVSVATMLEVLREMFGRNDLTNDLYFLFTDGEEIKMTGAAAFVEQNPEMKEKIDLVINLEARGNAGTLIMFETSPNSKNIIKALERNLDHITMFSVTAEIYKLMPNYTDLTEFIRAGYPGINFAIIDHPEAYHQMTDNFANLSRDSAYMYLKTTVSLADYFGKANLDTLKSNEDAVYFPFLKGNTIVLPNRVMVIISCLIGALTLAWILFRWVRKDFALKEMIFSFITMMGALFITALTGYLGSLLYSRLYNNGLGVTQIDSLNNIFYGTCCLSILAVVVWIWLAAKRFEGSRILLYGCLLLFNLLNWICTFALTGLSYIFTIPLALFFLYVVIETYSKKKPEPGWVGFSSPYSWGSSSAYYIRL